MANFSALKPPTTGTAITRKNGQIVVPDEPIIPFIEGDGTGPDIWRASVRVFDASVQKAFGGKRKIAWFEILAGEKAKNVSGEWLPNDTLEAVKTGEIIGTVVQDPFGFGYQAVKILASMARDKDNRILKSYPDIDSASRIVIPHRVITKEAGKLPETTGTLPVEPFFAELKVLKGDAK